MCLIQKLLMNCLSARLYVSATVVICIQTANHIVIDVFGMCNISKFTENSLVLNPCLIHSMSIMDENLRRCRAYNY